VVAAVAAARELPQLTLLDALELTMLIARKDSSRYPRVAARWLQRLLEEHPDVTIEEAALAASCLVALTGAGHREAAQALKPMAETATSRRRPVRASYRDDELQTRCRSCNSGEVAKSLLVRDCVCARAPIHLTEV
jgi:hypothetical protein